jgi:diphthamide biosynthesis enzyme Dph1/Dph2-like protein
MQFILKKKRCGKMKVEFLRAKYKEKFKIPKNFKEELSKIFKKNDNVAVFSAVQFREHIDEVREILSKESIKSEISKADRCSIEGQILGCDSYAESLHLDLSRINGFIYIGDGYFHPNALLLAQEYEKEVKPVMIINIVQQIIEVKSAKDIDRYLKKRKANLAKFQFSRIIGVFVTTKWGQEYLNSSLKLKEIHKDKEFYYFIGDNFNEYEMENFPHIECWVNTACPRIGQDDITRINKPLINIKDIYKK